MKALTLILAAALPACAVQSGKTYYANGNPKSSYLAFDLGRNVKGQYISPESSQIVEQNEAISFGTAALAGVSMHATAAQKAVDLGAQGVQKAGITSAASVDKAAIGADVTKHLSDNKTKVALEAIAP